MAEEPGEPSDGMTQPSREKSRWQKFKSWLWDFLGPCMVWLVGGTWGLFLFLSCLLAAKALAWPIVKAVGAGKGFPSYDIICYDIICIGVLVICGMFVARLCGSCGRNIVRLIQSSSGRVAVCLKDPICWASVMIAASCGSACLMLSLSSLTAFSLSSSWPWIWRVLLLGLFVFVLSVVLRLLWRPAKEWMEKLPLFVAIAIWAVLAIIAFLLAMWWLGHVPFWQLKLDPKKQAENIVKIALTLVGGVGAVAYLVIKYQERQQAGRAEKREKDRTIDTKVQDAINQLGSDKASTRIAGVYALTDIADRYKDSYRQRVACEVRPAEVRPAFEFGSAKAWDTFESGIREVHGFVECGFMEIERASAPQLVVIHRLPHDGFSGFVFPFLAQSVVHDGEDGGFHSLVRCYGFDEMAGGVPDGLPRPVRRI